MFYGNNQSANFNFCKANLSRLEKKTCTFLTFTQDQRPAASLARERVHVAAKRRTETNVHCLKPLIKDVKPWVRKQSFEKRSGRNCPSFSLLLTPFATLSRVMLQFIFFFQPPGPPGTVNFLIEPQPHNKRAFLFTTATTAVSKLHEIKLMFGNLLAHWLNYVKISCYSIQAQQNQNSLGGIHARFVGSCLDWMACMEPQHTRSSYGYKTHSLQDTFLLKGVSNLFQHQKVNFIYTHVQKPLVHKWLQALRTTSYKVKQHLVSWSVSFV